MNLRQKLQKLAGKYPPKLCAVCDHPESSHGLSNDSEYYCNGIDDDCWCDGFRPITSKILSDVSYFKNLLDHRDDVRKKVEDRKLQEFGQRLKEPLERCKCGHSPDDHKFIGPLDPDPCQVLIDTGYRSKARKCPCNEYSPVKL